MRTDYPLADFLATITIISIPFIIIGSSLLVWGLVKKNNKKKRNLFLTLIPLAVAISSVLGILWDVTRPMAPSVSNDSLASDNSAKHNSVSDVNKEDVLAELTRMDKAKRITIADSIIDDQARHLFNIDFRYYDHNGAQIQATDMRGFLAETFVNWEFEEDGDNLIFRNNHDLSNLSSLIENEEQKNPEGNSAPEEERKETEVHSIEDEDLVKRVEAIQNATREEHNALSKAEDYLSFSAFSKSGLKDQLIYEGFPEDTAQFAVDHIKVDWNEQALNKAIQYLEFSSFSDQRLYDQLIYEGFTPEQAQHAIDNLPD